MGDDRIDRPAETDPPPLTPGTVIRQTYTVDKLHARGGFADVYLVRHRFMGMQAMKVLRAAPHRHGDPPVSLQEAFILAATRHPNIVAVYDANVLDEEFGAREYLTMEFVDGANLADYARLHWPMTMRRCLDIACQASAGLAHAHAQSPPIVHRDVKPQNLLVAEVNETPRVKLGDFGLAVPVDQLLGARRAGTLLYLAPETFRRTATPASDVFSLALTLYEVVCGVLPYPASLLADRITAREFAHAIREAQRDPPRPPSYFRPEVPPELDDILLKALARDPEQRYADAGDLFAALNDLRLRSLGSPRASLPDSASRAQDLLAQAPGDRLPLKGGQGDSPPGFPRSDP